MLGKSYVFIDFYIVFCLLTFISFKHILSEVIYLITPIRMRYNSSNTLNHT